MTVSDEQSGIIRVLDDFCIQNRQMGADLTDQISELRCSFHTAIETLKVDLLERSSTATTVPKLVRAHDEEETTGLSTLLQTETLCTNIAASLHVLDSLRFEQIEFRHAKIHDAHPNTFTWILSDQFTRWIQSSEPIFWISGKPGSGKSTLMKFLADNPRTSQWLRQSSKEQKQVVASYYFWVNGTDIQRSQEGLLRALLYDLLRQCPEYIPHVVSEPWKVQQKTQASDVRLPYLWMRSELLSAFQRLTTLNASGTRFCIFVDGLDEYQGDHDELIEMICNLSRTNVKLCVASRPWNVFEEAFGKSLEFKIYLQDFNKADIRLYVKEKLIDRTDWQVLEEKDKRAAHDIVEEIVDKSKGVFLWVYLVVRSMVEGVRNRDRLSQLQKRLRDFPNDLEEFFRHIFESLDPTYHTQTAKAFQVALAAHQPLPLISYWFLDEEEDSPRPNISTAVHAISLEELDHRTTEMQVRLNGRCKGLLEFTTSSSGADIFVVDFLHRTVKDFLLTSEMQRTLASLQIESFDPDLSICTASIVALKSTSTVHHREELAILLFRSFFNSARHIEERSQMLPMEYFDELSRVIATLGKNRGQTESEYWSQFTSYRSLLSTATSYDLQMFVEAKLKTLKKPPADTLKELLSISMTPVTQAPHTPNLEMMRVILAFSPHTTLTQNIQNRLGNALGCGEDEEAYRFLRDLCGFATFEMSSEGTFKSQRLRAVLAELPSDQRVEILGLARRPKRTRTDRLRRFWR
jgi:hypothetical protein